MTTLQARHSDRIVRTGLSFFHNLLGACRPRDFALRFWDGTTWEAEPGQPTRFTLVIRHPGALRSFFLRPTEVTLGEAYIYDDLDIEGAVESIFALRDHFTSPRFGINQ